jgi:NTP pyrophosphatase (non-canonical NTP hydrolase)
MMATLDDVLFEISAWQYETFPGATARGAANHMAREAVEVIEATSQAESIAASGGRTTSTDEWLAEECADVLFLLNQVCNLRGIDLAAACAKKLEKNRKRVWKQADEHGVIEHVEGTHD